MKSFKQNDKTTFQKHPEESCEVEVSENELTDAKNIDHHFEVLCPNQVLKCALLMNAPIK